MNQRFYAPIALSVLLVSGVVLYFERPTVGHANASRTESHASLYPDGLNAEVAGRPGSCVSRPNVGVSRNTLDERYRWAHSLLEQRLYDAALPDLKDIARLDPGYPGIHHDLSTALLQTRHAEQAREAIDTQISISDCLSKLPSSEVESYCRTEFSQIGVDNCRVRLGEIRQAAQLQAALVHLELGHGMEPGQSAPPRVTEARAETNAGSHTLGVTGPMLKKVPSAEPGVVPSAPKKPAVDRTLMYGAGTDSDLGAYSKSPNSPE